MIQATVIPIRQHQFFAFHYYSDHFGADSVQSDEKNGKEINIILNLNSTRPKLKPIEHSFMHKIVSETDEIDFDLVNKTQIIFTNEKEKTTMNTNGEKNLPQNFSYFYSVHRTTNP